MKPLIIGATDERAKHIRMILKGKKTQTRRIHFHEWKLGKTYIFAAGQLVWKTTRIHQDNTQVSAET